jgi:hypothetical protein
MTDVMPALGSGSDTLALCRSEALRPIFRTGGMINANHRFVGACGYFRKEGRQRDRDRGNLAV